MLMTDMGTKCQTKPSHFENPGYSNHHASFFDDPLYD